MKVKELGQVTVKLKKFNKKEWRKALNRAGQYSLRVEKLEIGFPEAFE